MKTTNRWTRARVSLAAFAAALALPALAVAQEFEKVTGKAAEEVPAGRFVSLAYGFIWVAILLYVVSIARGLGRVRAEIDDVRRKVEGSNEGAVQPARR
jgi:CcmD family protein